MVNWRDHSNKSPRGRCEGRLTAAAEHYRQGYAKQIGLYDPVLEAHDGKVQVPNGPGWGVEINPDWLKRAVYQISEFEA